MNIAFIMPLIHRWKKIMDIHTDFGYVHLAPP